MESLYQELKTRFPNYPCSMTAGSTTAGSTTSDKITMKIFKDIKVLRLDNQYFMEWFGQLTHQQVIEKFATLTEEYEVIRQTLLEIQPSASFFNLSTEICYQGFFFISVCSFDVFFHILRNGDKFKIRVGPGIIYFEKITIDTPNCYESLKYLAIREIVAKRSKEYLDEEYIAVPDTVNDTLFNLVCRIINQQTELLYLNLPE